MKPLTTLVLLASFLLSPVLAELTYTVEATQDGVPIPASEIHLEPFEPGTIGHAFNKNITLPTRSKGSKLARRTNPTANSANWCGSVRLATSSNPIKLIHGVFQHPTCTRRTGQSYPQAVAAWVGIDGDSYTSALLQSGTVCKINAATGAIVNEVWYQWVPGAAYTLSTMAVSPGDWMEITINTTSTTAAKLTINNLTQGTQYIVTLTGGSTLGRVDADWVVERPKYGSSLAGFATFTDVWFETAYAKLNNGANLGILGAKQYQIPGLCASQEYDDATETSWSL